ncbi:MAG TPA: molybdopterin-binding protein [Myxococcota bacterium]|nr:molybdopterin-binding protein [Myxococcota bacterium]HND29434.1 molybdopterin-binding protein [Myxococcota bacterium]
MPTAAVVIIGNEILTGKFADENGPFLIARLRGLGLDLGRLVVVPDQMTVMVEELRRATSGFDWVFSTGGVGPTHDDMTFPAVAAAFGVPLVREPVLEKMILSKFGDNTAALRMAEIPAGAELWWDGEIAWPQVVMRNLVIFPGVPKLVRMKFDAICHRFSGTPMLTRRIQTLADESEIADVLTTAAQRWPSVDIGSYPRFDERPHRVIVTMEARDSESLAACAAWLLSHVPGAASAPG